MNAQQTTGEGKVKEVVFDEHGQTVEGGGAEETEAAIETTTEMEDQTETVESTETTQTTTLKGSGKYRIGDRYFETQEAALEYAQSQTVALETEAQVADAYRQGVKDALVRAQQSGQNVTPEKVAPKFNVEELYTSPDQFLAKYASQIKEETRAEIDSREAQRAQDSAIWNEFSGRHPMLADFRREVDEFVGTNQDVVRGIASTKGKEAAYDYVATKVRARFEAYASAVKPKRELPNGGTVAAPATKTTNVTQKGGTEKVLSFAEQVRSLRKRS